jgi:serine/threonine-protein kinase
MTSAPADHGSIGPYRVVRRLGFGRKSEVVLATRKFLGDFERTVVVKRLLSRCADDPERQDVIAAEALAYARVSHPAIVQLFDVFSHEGHLALVLEYVDGLSLTNVVEGLRARRERLGDRAALYIAGRLFAALAAAHSAKDPRTGEITPVIHRDVSPANVLVPWDGFVKLGDFDLSKVIGVSGDTRGGLMKGTYGYMAPEQITGEPVTPRTDVYAGCLVLRELLLGRPAFDERLAELELLKSMLEPRLAPVETLRTGVPRRLANALARGLVPDANHRSISASEMVEVIRSYVDMEQAHAELVSRVQRLRPGSSAASRAAQPSSSSSARASRPSLRPSSAPLVTPPAFPTPRAMTISNVDSLRPVEEGASVPPVRSRTRSLSVIGVATFVAVFVVVFGVATFLQSPHGQAGGASVAAQPPPPEPSASLAGATVVPTAAVAPPAPTFGTIVPPVAARHHRMWVDGELVDLAKDPTLKVSCGPHVVRVGSSGAAQSIDVPCGGRVTVRGE